MKMTRVDIIPAKDFHTKHLISGNREIKRIPNAIISGRFNLSDAPKEYKLGEGSVKFFYDKIKFLHRQYLAVYNEGIKRGLNLTDFSKSFEKVKVEHPELYNDWTPSVRDLKINLERINERVASW